MQVGTFNTLILREILKIQNPLRGEHYAILEVIHLFQSVGCARNKLMFLTAQQNLKSSLWTLDWDWMVFPHLIYEIWLFLYAIKDIDLFLPMSNPRVKKPHCMCLRIVKLWSKWLWKAEVLHWDTSPELTELLLIGFSIESIWTPKSTIKYIDTKNQLADILTKGNFTRDEWNHLLCLFYISHIFLKLC